MSLITTPQKAFLRIATHADIWSQIISQRHHQEWLLHSGHNKLRKLITLFGSSLLSFPPEHPTKKKNYNIYKPVILPVFYGPLLTYANRGSIECRGYKVVAEIFLIRKGTKLCK